ncbi:MAG TPA: hypothetical protein VN024_09770 [Bradyrhizobium sp.]|nr:hypothetical protein [Bradyrhizobium sp.]HWX58781.1 hypothetical protein [Bradyrhizobium sp.]
MRQLEHRIACKLAGGSEADDGRTDRELLWPPGEAIAQDETLVPGLMHDDSKTTSTGITDLISIWARLQFLDRDGGERLGHRNPPEYLRGIVGVTITRCLGVSALVPHN